MQNATQSNLAPNHVPRYSQRLVVFPAKAAPRVSASDARARFERLLIFVLFSLWAVGMVAWTMVSVAGIGHAVVPGGLSFHSPSVPTSLPTLQSATVFAVRLVFGW